MKKIVLSIGHNWENGDRGAVGNGTTEADVTSAIADEILTKNFSNFQFLKTPKNLGILARAKWANSQNADLFIELHLDSASPQATGATIFYADGNSYTKSIGEKFLKKYCEKTSLRNRGTKSDVTTRHGRLGFLRNSQKPSLLLELGFISNGSDLEQVRKLGAIAILEGIEEIFGEKILYANNEKMDHDYLKILADEMAENPEYEAVYKEHDQRKAEIEIGLLRFWKKYIKKEQ